MNKFYETRHLQLKPATQGIISEVIEIEKQAGNAGFSGRDSEDKHLTYLTDNDVAYWVITPKNKPQIIGYVILKGLRRTFHHGSIELKRIALTETDQGYGQEILNQIKKIVFEELNAHRLWVTFYDHNERALHVYQREGFKQEGTLRESIKLPDDSYANLVVLSMLESEYKAQQA